MLPAVKVSQQVSICHNLPTILKAEQLFHLYNILLCQFQFLKFDL